METSTVLQKTNRIRIYEKTKLYNLVNHILRNYKPDTIQYKKDFNPNDTKLNLVIGADFQIIEKGPDWFDKVQTESQSLKDTLQQSLIEADEMAEQNISLSRQQKDLTLKSITYFSKLKNYDKQAESKILQIISKCIDVKNQEKNNKDYSVIDQESLKTALDFYENPPENIKIKGLNAKKKHLTQILETVDKMQVHNDRRATASTRSIGFEDVLFKIPKHNDKSLKDTDMISIMKDWNDEYFSDYAILGGALHKDERTKKGNAADDHLHLLRSGFNRTTKRFDLPDYTHQLGLKLAQEQGIPFDPDGKKYNKTTEILRTVSSEALQTEFYRFANERLKKLGYEFRFEKKEITPEEQELRVFLKEQSKLPKSQRMQNLHSFMEEQAKKEQQNRNEQVKVANKAIGAKKKAISEKNNATAEKEKEKARTEKIIKKRKSNEKKIKSSTKRLNEINKQIEQNESWFVNFVKSEPIQEYLNGVRRYFEKGFNFKLYQEVTDFLRSLNKSNEKMIDKIKAHNPDWLKEQEEKAKQLAEEKRIKHENRFKGGVFEEDIELDDIKVEVNEKIKQENKQEIDLPEKNKKRMSLNPFKRR